jgi:hypothetical protein
MFSSPAQDAIVTPSPRIKGVGVPGAVVTVLDGEAIIATVTVAADGSWSTPTVLQRGPHIVTATQTAGGRTSPPAVRSFIVNMGN